VKERNFSQPSWDVEHTFTMVLRWIKSKIPSRTAEHPFPEIPNFFLQGFLDPPADEISGAIAESATMELVPEGPTLRAPLPHAPEALEEPQRWHREEE
jgi:hypothetical protein